MVSFRTIAPKHEYNAIAFLQITAKSKTRDKYFLLFFMHRSEIGILITFAKIYRRWRLNKVQGDAEEDWKFVWLEINITEV